MRVLTARQSVIMVTTDMVVIKKLNVKNLEKVGDGQLEVQYADRVDHS